MSVFSRLKRMNVHVYESTRLGFKRISRFDVPSNRGRTAHVLYSGRAHFDAIEVLRRRRSNNTERGVDRDGSGRGKLGFL